MRKKKSECKKCEFGLPFIHGNPQLYCIYFKDVEPPRCEIINPNGACHGFSHSIAKERLTKFIFIDLKDSSGGFMIPESEDSIEIIEEILKDPKYVLREGED